MSFPPCIEVNRSFVLLRISRLEISARILFPHIKSYNYMYFNGKLICDFEVINTLLCDGLGNHHTSILSLDTVFLPVTLAAGSQPRQDSPGKERQCCVYTSAFPAISEAPICDCKLNSSFSVVLGLDSRPRKRACGRRAGVRKSPCPLT